MRRARANLATVGVFSWALLEPEQGRYDFTWLDAHFERLHANGVAVDLATPTAPVSCTAAATPTASPRPSYRSAARRIASALAERYGAPHRRPHRDPAHRALRGAAPHHPHGTGRSLSAAPAAHSTNHERTPQGARSEPARPRHQPRAPRVPPRPEHLPCRRRLLPRLLQLRVLPRRTRLPQQ
ncbi:beta-galactosidase [Streptomyces sp. AS02]|nr:beta-galactosidase [Streptomyces sp. AS02]